MAEADANVAALAETLRAPLVADLPWRPAPGAADPSDGAGRAVRLADVTATHVRMRQT